MDRQMLIRRMWLQDRANVFIGRKEYFRMYDGWDVTAHLVGDLLVGAVVTRGPEFHFATFGGKWFLTRQVIRKYLGPILEEHGCVQTKTPKDDLRQQRFNKIIGFEADGEDEFFVHFKLTRLRHA